MRVTDCVAQTVWTCPFSPESAMRGLGVGAAEYSLRSVQLLPDLWIKVLGVADADASARDVVWMAVTSLRVVVR